MGSRADEVDSSCSRSARPTADARAVCPVVATDQDVWSVITLIAEINSSDVLVDIGCGDGRFLAHAARTCQCHCIGIDVRQSCLKDTRRAAERWGVRHLVEAIEEDFMNLESLQRIVESATVVYCFLLPHIIRTIEPVLLRAVSAGKRVVLFCSTGARIRRLDQQAMPTTAKPGNAIGDLVPSAVAWFGRLRCYGHRVEATLATVNSSLSLTTHITPQHGAPKGAAPIVAMPRLVGRSTFGDLASVSIIPPRQQPPCMPLSLLPLVRTPSRPPTAQSPHEHSLSNAQHSLPPPTLTWPLPPTPGIEVAEMALAAVIPCSPQTSRDPEAHARGLTRAISRSQLLPVFIQTRLPHQRAEPVSLPALGSDPILLPPTPIKAPALLLQERLRPISMTTTRWSKVSATERRRLLRAKATEIRIGSGRGSCGRSFLDVIPRA